MASLPRGASIQNYRIRIANGEKESTREKGKRRWLQDAGPEVSRETHAAVSSQMARRSGGRFDE